MFLDKVLSIWSWPWTSYVAKAAAFQYCHPVWKSLPCGLWRLFKMTLVAALIWLKWIANLTGSRLTWEASFWTRLWGVSGFTVLPEGKTHFKCERYHLTVCGYHPARVLDMEGTIPLALAREVSHWLGAGLNKMKEDWTLGLWLNASWLQSSVASSSHCCDFPRMSCTLHCESK